MSAATGHRTLLVELLTEELPPKALARLGAAFAEGIRAGLDKHKFLAEGSVSTAYATPRRLAVSITQVAARSPDVKLREKILPVSVAFGPDGQPTPALTKKLAARGFEATQPSVSRDLRDLGVGKAGGRYVLADELGPEPRDAHAEVVHFVRDARPGGGVA